MKVFVVLSSLLAVSLAAPSINPRYVEERVLRDALDEGADVERSPATAAELLELRELQLRINAMLEKEEIENHKAKSGLRTLEGLDSAYGLEQELLKPSRSSYEEQLAEMILLQMSPDQLRSLVYFYSPSMPSRLSLEDRLMIARRQRDMSPLQQLAFMKEEKVLDLHKDDDLLKHKRNQLTLLQELLLIKKEKLLELQKEEDLLEHRRNQLGPLQTLELMKEEKMLELQKDEDMLDHRKNQMGPLQTLALLKEEKLLEIQKDEDLLKRRRIQLGPLQTLELLKEEKLLELQKEEDLLERRRNQLTPLQELSLLEDEKMFGLHKDKDEKLFDYKRNQLSPLQELALLKEEKILDLNKDEDLFKLRQQETLKEELLEALI